VSEFLSTDGSKFVFSFNFVRILKGCVILRMIKFRNKNNKTNVKNKEKRKSVWRKTREKEVKKSEFKIDIYS